MNKEQAKQLEENPIWKAIKEGKTIQRCPEPYDVSLGSIHYEWKYVEKFDVMRLLSNPEEFRVKPELKEWEQEGWRTRDPEEIIEEGDWFIGIVSSEKIEKDSCDIGTRPLNVYKYRTNRPIPDSFLVKELQKELKENQNLIDLQRTMITEANKKLNEALKLPYEAF